MPNLFEGFKKVAWDLDTARAANVDTKKRLVRRSVWPIVHKRMGGEGKGLDLGAASVGVAPKHLKSIAAEQAAAQPILRQGAGKIFTKGQALAPLAAVGFRPKGVKSPENKEMFNRTTLQHERSELKWYPRIKKDSPFSHGFMTHGHPQAILEESNMIATMPKKHKGVANAFTRMRMVDGTKDTLEYGARGFKYGKTRLSRHGRKRVQELLFKKLRDLR